VAAGTGIAAYALATRLFPDRFGYEAAAAYQLARPVGYWNALGILAAIAIVLALGFCSAPERLPRALAAGAVPLLLTTLYVTFSRGALVALAVGLAAAFAVERNRLRLAATALVVAPPAAVAVVLASRSDALARERASLAQAVREGHRLAVALVLLTAVAALLGLALGRLRAAVRVTPRARRAISAALAALGAAAVLAVLVAAGGPVSLVERAYDSFRAPLPASGGELEGRLFSVSGNGRADYWRIALDAYADHPALGSGAGTYELHWHRERPTAFGARDAHSLYLETLAELGPVGLLLLLAVLCVPFVALPRAREAPLAAAALGAYAAYLAHAALDWDWEMPAVTLAAIACAGVLLVSARRPPDDRGLDPRARAAGLAAAALLGAFAFVAYIGNSALATASDAAALGRHERAAADARRAARWAPWAAEPWQALGAAQLALGRRDEARASYREALEQDPRDWSLWYELALASDGAARRDALARARALNPRAAELDALQGG
jgi:O-antigen ligase